MNNDQFSNPKIFFIPTIKSQFCHEEIDFLEFELFWMLTLEKGI